MASRYESFSRFFDCCGFLVHRFIYHHYLCITSRITIFESAYDILFTGRGDGTICFYCNGGLKNWRPTDDAWREHALWFPYYVYIRYIKGEISYANVRAVYTRVITLHYPVFPKLLLYIRWRVDTFRHLFNVDVRVCVCVCVMCCKCIYQIWCS